MSLTYQEAAARLNIPVKWLQTHIKSLPHFKYGHYVRFSESDIERIHDMFHVEPKTTADIAAIPHITVLRDHALRRQPKRKAA